MENNNREFEFTRQDFQLIQKLIYQRAGISLGECKFELAYSRIARRLRAKGMKTFAEYLRFLQRDGADEWEEFTNALTTNLTSFFREPHHFKVLEDHMRKLGKASPIEIWCSACSTGEEAYSIAMTAVETFGGFDTPVRIVASDLDTKVLETARNGRYKPESVKRMLPQKVQRFFTHVDGVDGGAYEIRPELKKMIQFRQVNLLSPTWPVREELDAIFCRNVMIYFDKPTQLSILRKFAPLLRADGLLFAGHSENFFHAADYFKLRGQTVYELSNKYKTDNS